jgi:hypothetical protein
MMSETMFVAMLALFWVAEFLFGSLVVYWFLQQGFGNEGVASGELFPLEDPAVTKQSLGIWGLFFAGIVVMIIVAA